MRSDCCALCGASENIWLELHPDGTWRCRDRDACLVRRRQGRLFVVRTDPRDDELLRLCAAGARAVDRAVTRFRTPHEAPRFDPPKGLAA